MCNFLLGLQKEVGLQKANRANVRTKFLIRTTNIIGCNIYNG